MKTIIVISFALCVSLVKGAGFNLVINSGEIEVDEAYFNKPKVHIKSEGNSARVDIEGTALQQIDDVDVRVELKIEGADGKLVDFVNTPAVNLCKFFEKPDDLPIIKFLMEDMRKFGNFSTSCPIVKGDYYLHNYHLDNQKIPSIALPGNYRLITDLLVNSKVVWKAMWNASIMKA